jgi:lipopolysaccharide/colanic/teichoic acid biosynthesis glycosyltransferase
MRQLCRITVTTSALDLGDLGRDGVTLKLKNMRQHQTIHGIVPRKSMAPRVMRLGDVVLAALLLSATLPLMMIVAIIIKLESRGVILDKQMCIGGGRRFRMLKFRTIEYAPHLVPPPQTHWPTPVGRFLRRTRIEALPQFINVLRGDISILDPDGSRPSFLD